MTQTIPPPPDDDPTSVLDPAPPPGPPPGGEPEAARRLGWGLALGALVLIAVAAAAAAAYFATRGSSSSSAETTAAAATTAPTTTAALVPAGRAIVPDVTGLKEDKAAARLGAAHLNPQVKTKATPKPTGIVVSQTPPAGKQAKQGSSVTIVVDAGAPAVAVPDLTGLRVAAAGKRLADAKLKAQTTQVTAAKPAGTVVSQAPPAGTKLTQGSVVTLSVARGSATAGTTTTATTTAAAPTTTTPKTTTSAPPAHPSTATVPDVTNGTLADAADALAQAGLFPNVAYVPGTDPLGTVLEQAKQAGTTTQWGGYVRVNVSKGSEPPANATVPDLSGRPRADGMQALSSAGFEVKVLWKQVASSVKNDIVLDEQPSRGTQAPRGALVILIVSRQPGR
ncbi:MAG TPA: PASTA domain-containing protein [Gaiellaceae bacterium]|nr:PASTA domain-containing protein [Gaiellaceae bacterium]